MLPHLEHGKHQLITVASGIALLIQIRKSYEKTSLQSQGDAGLNLERPSSDWSPTTLVRVKISTSVILNEKAE